MEYNFNEQNNVATIVGTVVKLPQVSHEIEGERFLDLEVEVERLSKAKDVIPVTMSERILGNTTLNVGDRILLNGQYRSHNKSVNEKSKLVLQFFAKDFSTDVDAKEQINKVKLVGYICKKPVFRTTPFNREICDVLLAVNRGNYHRSDYIPCILWGRNARFISNQSIGTKLEIEGRIQSREYTKTLEDGTAEERTAYEVSCTSVSILGNSLKLEKLSDDIKVIQ